jgi:hypothetical protein
MNRNWTIGICLTLLLIGGFALDASAQQPSAPAPSTPAVPAEPKPQAPDSSTPQPSQPPSPQMQQAPSTNVQTETRTEKSERIIEREPGKFLGVDPTVAMILGAALLIVIVFALVAMSRRRDEIQHTHTRV